MKKYSFIFFLLLCNPAILFSQRFYLKPYLETKININTPPAGENFQPANSFKYQSKRVIYNNCIPNSFGFLFGLETRNGKNSFETGYYSTKTSSSIDAYFYEYVPSNKGNYYTPSTYSVINSASLLSIPFRYIYSSNKNIAIGHHKLTVSFSYELGLYYSFKRDYQMNRLNENNYASRISPNDTLFIHSYYGISGFRGSRGNHLFSYEFLYIAGISATIRNNKSTELFTLSFLFYFSNNIKSYTVFDVKSQGVSKQVNSQSTGTGVGLSISKSFTLFKYKTK